MKRFNSSKVRPSDYLQPVSEKQKRYLRRVRGVSKAFALDREAAPVVKLRDFTTAVKPSWKPAKRRGANCCRLSDAKREMIKAAMVRRHDAREAFFASLGGAG